MMESVLPNIASHIESVFGIKPQVVNNHTWVKTVSQRMVQTKSEDAGKYLNYLLRSQRKG